MLEDKLKREVPRLKPAPSLVVSRGEAEEKMRAQIDKGVAIRDREITTAAELDSAEDAQSQWSRENIELLTKIFDNDTAAAEYKGIWMMGDPLLGTPTLRQQIQEFRGMINGKIKKLESIKERFGGSAGAPTTAPQPGISDSAAQTAVPVQKHDISAADQKNDIHGNNAAVTCPVCGKIFIVSASLDNGSRVCPKCKMATAHISQTPPYQAWVEWKK